MKLVFDQNLSAALPRHVSREFPESAHLRDFDMARASDSEVLEFAARAGYVIVTKDRDFAQRMADRTPPPKMIWLRLGNCRTQVVADTLRAEQERITVFALNPDLSVLELPSSAMA